MIRKKKIEVTQQKTEKHTHRGTEEPSPEDTQTYKASKAKTTMKLLPPKKIDKGIFKKKRVAQKSQPEISIKTHKIETYFMRGKVKLGDQLKLTTGATSEAARLGKGDYEDEDLMAETLTEPRQDEPRTRIKTNRPRKSS